MLNESSLKALNLLINNQVRVIQVTPNFLFFKAGNQEVRYDYRKDTFMCLCIHEVFRGDVRDKNCYHVKSVKYWMNKNSDFMDWFMSEVTKNE